MSSGSVSQRSRERQKLLWAAGVTCLTLRGSWLSIFLSPGMLLPSACPHGSVYFASSSGSFSQEHHFQTEVDSILSPPWPHSHSKTPSVRHNHTLKMSSWPNGTNLESQHQDQAPEQDSRKMRERKEREKERETCHWCGDFLLVSRL